MTEPEVSVVILTYNHEPFIRQAVESILSQCTAFPFEIIITEDCSTDRTREIVQSFHRQYPNQIRLMLSESNQNECDKNSLNAAALIRMSLKCSIAAVSNDGIEPPATIFQQCRNHYRRFHMPP